jgi:hypothetical protein
MFLKEIVQIVTTTWTTGGTVGVLFTSRLKHGGMRYRPVILTFMKSGNNNKKPATTTSVGTEIFLALVSQAH